MNNNEQRPINYTAVRPGSPHGKERTTAILKTIVDGHARNIQQMARILSVMVKEGRLNTEIPQLNVETNSAVTPTPVTPPRSNTPPPNAFNTPPRVRGGKRTRLAF